MTINGLAIVNDKPNPGYAFHTQPPGGLPEWYRQNVIGGPGAFLRVIEDFHSFADAMTNKLVSEIATAPPLLQERRADPRAHPPLPSPTKPFRAWLPSLRNAPGCPGKFSSARNESRP